MLGGGITVKVTPLLFVPFTRTTTAPVTALDGTGTAILVLLQLVGMPVTPLPPLANVTVLVPWLKVLPLLVQSPVSEIVLALAFMVPLVKVKLPVLLTVAVMFTVEP